MSADQRVLILAHAEARRRAVDAVREAPDGYKVTIGPVKRNLEINAALHASIAEVAERVTWAGRKWDAETWKRLLTASWSRAIGNQATVLPALDGYGVDIVMRRTSDMTQAEVRDLLAWIDAWKAERPE
jgi:NinB protein